MGIATIIWQLVQDIFAFRALHCLHKDGYLQEHGWFLSFKKKTAIDKNGNVIPWLSYPATDFIARRLKPEMRVFEYGSGASTQWFASHVKEVVSCEHDRQWFDVVQSKVPNNVTLKYIPLDDGDLYAKEITRYHEEFDIVFIDGCRRNECMKNAIPSLKADGIIILDDSCLEKYRQGKDYLLQSGFKSIEITGPAPIYNNCCETMIFYRPDNVFKI